MNISIERIDRTMLQEVRYTGLPPKDKLVKIAALYANAFADPPWNEYKVCKKGHYSGKEFADLTKCTTCNELLELAYPEDQTVDYISNEIGKPNGTLITFEDQRTGEVYAAGWGYTCTIEELKTKYKTTEMKEKVEVAIKKTALNADKIFYLSETMVDSCVRKQGIATQIFDGLLKRTNELGLKMVMRTHIQSPMVGIAEKKAMTRIINEGQDSEIQDRVLYIAIAK